MRRLDFLWPMATCPPELNEALRDPCHLTQLVDAMADAIAKGIPLKALCGLWLPTRPGRWDYGILCDSHAKIATELAHVFTQVGDDIQRVAGQPFDAVAMRNQLFAPLAPQHIRSIILSAEASNLITLDMSYEELAPFGASVSAVYRRELALCEAHHQNEIATDVLLFELETCLLRARILLPLLGTIPPRELAEFDAYCNEELQELREDKQRTSSSPKPN